MVFDCVCASQAQLWQHFAESFVNLTVRFPFGFLVTIYSVFSSRENVKSIVFGYGYFSICLTNIV